MDSFTVPKLSGEALNEIRAQILSEIRAGLSDAAETLIASEADESPAARTCLLALKLMAAKADLALQLDGSPGCSAPDAWVLSDVARQMLSKGTPPEAPARAQ